MLKFKQLDHVLLRVVDLRAMMHFYIDVLGCTLEKVQEKIGLWQIRAGTSLIDLRAATSIISAFRWSRSTARRSSPT